MTEHTVWIRHKRKIGLIAALVVMSLVASSGSAQELEPRAYRTMPTGIVRCRR